MAICSAFTFIGILFDQNFRDSLQLKYIWPDVANYCLCGKIVESLTGIVSTNTKSLANEFSKILIFEYFGYLKIGFDVFFDADSE